MILSIYSLLTQAGAPFFRVMVKRRLVRGKEDPHRYPEKFAETQMPRPAGFLIWCHGASVGETRTLLPLVKKILKTHPQGQVLVTSGTLTSARLMERELPPRAIHQFLPLDVPSWGKKFLNHWAPDVAMFTESEIWPNLIVDLTRRGIPKILLNARLSPTSFSRWQMFKKTAQQIFGSFDLVLAQGNEEARKFQNLGARSVHALENLKYAAEPLRPDPRLLQAIKRQIRGRPLWLALSTHPGEEEQIANLHTKLKKKFPELLTLIIPRHPERGEFIHHLLMIHKLKVSRRSLGQKIDPETDVYLADTLGETGTFLALSDLVFLGGSLVPIGGHNILEPAHAKATIMVGPFMHLQKNLLKDFMQSRAIIQVKGSQELEKTLRIYLSDPKKRQFMGARAQKQAREKAHVLEEVWRTLQPFLEKTLGKVGKIR